MRIIQIIDSLAVGGAERMAVNYANTLSERIAFSGLVATRKEGFLLDQISNKVSYLFLNKKSSLDFKAIFRLRKFVIRNKVTIVHAHGTSFFTATALKFTYPKIKIVWHDHYGARAKQSTRNHLALLFCSLFFSSIYVVNYQIESWVKKNLFCNKVYYIPNFVSLNTNENSITKLNGNDGKRIVCVANLKNPKNHIALVRAFQEMKLKPLGWSIHLIGKDYQDNYSQLLKEFIRANVLENTVFIYDSRNDVQNILSQATIGILCSTDEGFPMSLLEYGWAQLPVVSTNVGFCPEIIQHDFSGLLFDACDHFQLQQQLQKMILDKESRARFGLNLHQFVLENFSMEKGIQSVLAKYETL